MPGLICAGANDAKELIGHAGPMLLIEPLDGPFARLERNFKDRPDVRLVQIALGAKPGWAEMYVSDYDESSSLLAPEKHLELYVAKFDGRQKVVVDTLDRVLAGMGGDYDEMILDVQGYELEVLKGATETLRKLRKITTEVNTVHLYRDGVLLEELDAYLREHGFKQTKLDIHGVQGAWGDAVYERADEA